MQESWLASGFHQRKGIPSALRLTRDTEQALLKKLGGRYAALSTPPQPNTGSAFPPIATGKHNAQFGVGIPLEAVNGLVRCVHPGAADHVSFGTVLDVGFDGGLNQSYMDVEDLEGRVLDAIKEIGCDLTILCNYGNVAPPTEPVTSGHWDEVTYDSLTDTTTFKDNSGTFPAHAIDWWVQPDAGRSTYLDIVTISASEIVVAGDATGLAHGLIQQPLPDPDIIGTFYTIVWPVGVDPATGTLAHDDPCNPASRLLFAGYYYMPPVAGTTVPPSGGSPGVYGKQPGGNFAGDYYCWNRRYDSSIGRWTSPDPASSPYWNLLDYVGAQPLSERDTTGLESKELPPYIWRGKRVTIIKRGDGTLKIARSKSRKERQRDGATQDDKFGQVIRKAFVGCADAKDLLEEYFTKSMTIKANQTWMSFLGKTDRDKRTIFLKSGKADCETLAVLGFEVMNYKATDEFAKCEAACKYTGDADMEEYVKCMERVEFQNFKKANDLYEKCKGSWACQGDCRYKDRSEQTFDEYWKEYNDPKANPMAAGHMETYRVLWRSRKKTRESILKMFKDNDVDIDLD